jgi:hypothetical protein
MLPLLLVEFQIAGYILTGECDDEQSEHHKRQTVVVKEASQEQTSVDVRESL